MINSNIGCIETGICYDDVKNCEQINSNIGCIETNNFCGMGVTQND